jgi:hypothetical protein
MIYQVSDIETLQLDLLHVVMANERKTRTLSEASEECDTTDPFVTQAWTKLINVCKVTPLDLLSAIFSLSVHLG